MSTVGLEVWSGVKNGKLVALAACKCDALIMLDKKLPCQQNTSSFPVAVGVLDAQSIELCYLLPPVPALDAALENLEPGSDLLPRSGT